MTIKVLTNSEGLTYEEWARAAHYKVPYTKAVWDAWSKGEDPSDHRKMNDDKAYKEYEESQKQEATCPLQH